jgi:excisionase family DNA binding protein
MITDLKLYTVKEAAAILRVAKSTVYELIKKGRLPCAHIGVNGRGKKIITEQAITDFFLSCQGEIDD